MLPSQQQANCERLFVVRSERRFGFLMRSLVRERVDRAEARSGRTSGAFVEARGRARPSGVRMAEKDGHRGAPGGARIRKGVALIVFGAALTVFALAIIGPSEDLSLGKVAGWRGRLVAVARFGARAAARPRPGGEVRHECEPDSSHAPAMTRAERELARKYVRGQFEGATWRMARRCTSSGAAAVRQRVRHARGARVHRRTRGGVVRRDSRVARDAMHERARLLAPLLPRPGGAMAKWGGRPQAHLRRRLRRYHAAVHPGPEPIHGGDVRRRVDRRPVQNRVRVVRVAVLKETSVVLWHATARTMGRQPPDGEVFQFDRTARDPKTHGPQSRMYSKAAARIFDRVEHVDALAVFG